MRRWVIVAWAIVAVLWTGCGASTGSQHASGVRATSTTAGGQSPQPEKPKKAASKSECLRGQDPSDALPPAWTAEGRTIDEYYADDCFASDAQIAWYEHDADPAIQAMGRSLRVADDCMREHGYGGLDPVPQAVMDACLRRGQAAQK